MGRYGEKHRYSGDFLPIEGKRVQPKRCFGFLLSKGAHSYVENDCKPWSVCGEALRLTGSEVKERYLRMELGPGTAIGLPELVLQTQQWVERIGRAALKPSQKVEILTRYAIPRLLYQLDYGQAGVTLLNRIDLVIRGAVKRWLHLPPSTTDGLLYSRYKDGGLNISKLARQVPCIQARRVFRLRRSEDPLTRLATTSLFPREKFECLWLSAGGLLEQVPDLEEQSSEA